LTAIGGEGRRPKDWLLAAALLGPSLAIFGAFTFYPFYRLVYLGFHQQNRTGTRERWAGVEQYTEVLTGRDFLDGLWITVQYVLYTVPAGLVLGVVLAVVANRRLKGIKVFHTIFSSTVATSVAVASVIFFVLINPTTGYFNDVGFISLSDPDSALRGVALSSIWGNLGLTFIIVLAGLQTVPDELMEAATLDGFGPLRRFFKVTLPLLSPTLLFLVVVLTIFAFQAFGQIDILTNGGPAESTETLVFKIFHSQQPVDLGVGAVMAVGLFFVTFVVTLGQFLILDRRVHYGGD
jgi:sn-glycerol 3-phosphate transport system permease protein